MGWFFALMVALLFALVGWTLIGVAEEIDALRSEIWDLSHETKKLRREFGKVK